MDNIDLIRKIAWSFHQTTGIEFDDLFQEAYIGYAHAMKTYDPKKGKISTHIWWCVSAQLKRYLYQQEEYKCKKYQNGFILSMEDINVESFKVTYQNHFWESLTREAQEIVELVLTTPTPFIKNGRIKARKRVGNIMTQRGWSMKKVKFGLSNLKIVYFLH